MMASRSEVWLESLSQTELDWLVSLGVATSALVRPTVTTSASGFRAEDGLFEYSAQGERWLAFEHDDDFVFWQPRRGALATYGDRAFALGGDIIADAGTYALGSALNIFADPLDWLRAQRDGIVVLDWSRAFDRLRDAPQIAIVESLLPLYRRHMKPARLPELLVITGNRRAA